MEFEDSGLVGYEADRDGGAAADDPGIDVELGDGWRVQLHDNLLQTLGEWLNPEQVSIRYQ